MTINKRQYIVFNTQYAGINLNTNTNMHIQYLLQFNTNTYTTPVTGELVIASREQRAEAKTETRRERKVTHTHGCISNI